MNTNKWPEASILYWCYLLTTEKFCKVQKSNTKRTRRRKKEVRQEKDIVAEELSEIEAMGGGILITQLQSWMGSRSNVTKTQSVRGLMNTK